MAAIRAHRKPTFIWQAVLILLPVALMAGFGFWAILRERNAVEAQAQQRAREILSSLPDDFGRIAASRLTQFDGPKGGWFEYLRRGLAAWPEDKTHNAFLNDTNEIAIITREVADLHSAFPDWQSGPLPLLNFWLKTNGDLSFDLQIPPRPPAWTATMTANQQQAWTALQSADCASESLSSLVTAFRQTQPPAPALACADFMQLRAQLSSTSATNAINQLLWFADRHGGDVSDSGVPLRTLALAEALKHARKGGPTARLWERLQSEIDSPNALTPILLDEAGQLVANDPQLTEAVKAMRILLDDKSAQAELAEAVKQTGKLHGITTTNLWLNAMGWRWFCVLSPTDVRCYPKSIVARGFADAFKDANVSVPDYLSISLELEGEPVPLPSPWSKSSDGKPSGDILAEGKFQMFHPGFKGEIPFEAMPSHPQFSTQIRLTNRGLLYTRQRQLQIIFGALIAVSALAALIGFVAAYRAFRREQQLNELKSNFVSSVSHELRAPIASVRLMAENLERGKIPESQKQNEYFRFIVQECRRLSSLIENVLDFSRIEQGRKQYEFEPTDLVALTQTTVNLMEPYAAEKGVVLKWEKFNIQHSTPNIELAVDGRAIQQALVNLIDNAVKHSPKGESVTVKLSVGGAGVPPAVSGVAPETRVGDREPQGPQTCEDSTMGEAIRRDAESNGPEARATRCILISVSDRGSGIPAAEREKIFERFYRCGSELRRGTQGVGIGLSIVNHIVDAHGGQVRVASEVGKGSRFTIELPFEK